MKFIANNQTDLEIIIGDIKECKKLLVMLSLFIISIKNPVSQQTNWKNERKKNNKQESK